MPSPPLMCLKSRIELGTAGSSVRAAGARRVPDDEICMIASTVFSLFLSTTHRRCISSRKLERRVGKDGSSRGVMGVKDR